MLGWHNRNVKSQIFLPKIFPNVNELLQGHLLANNFCKNFYCSNLGGDKDGKYKEGKERGTETCLSGLKIPEAF